MKLAPNKSKADIGHENNVFDGAALTAGLALFLLLTAGFAVAVAVAVAVGAVPVCEFSGANVIGLNSNPVSMTIG